MPCECCYVESTLTVNTASLFNNIFIITVFVWIHFLSRVNALVKSLNRNFRKLCDFFFFPQKAGATLAEWCSWLSSAKIFCIVQ